MWGLCLQTVNELPLGQEMLEGNLRSGFPGSQQNIVLFSIGSDIFTMCSAESLRSLQCGLCLPDAAKRQLFFTPFDRFNKHSCLAVNSSGMGRTVPRQGGQEAWTY